MKKSVLMKVFLILLPAMAVLLATTGDSVTVFDPQNGTVQAYSYFSPIPVGKLTMCTPLAAILAVASTILGVVFVAWRKTWSIIAICWIAPVSATAAVSPILLRGEIVVVPNALFPILMMVQWWLASVINKKPEILTVETITKKLKKK